MVSVILRILRIIYVEDIALYSKCNQVSDLWQQLELASEIESDLQGTVNWGRKWLVDVTAEKNRLIWVDPWPSIFTRPVTLHFCTENSRLKVKRHCNGLKTAKWVDKEIGLSNNQ